MNDETQNRFDRQENANKDRGLNWVQLSIVGLVFPLIVAVVPAFLFRSSDRGSPPQQIPPTPLPQSPSDSKSPPPVVKDTPKSATTSAAELRCPKCGGPMVLRHNRTTGEAFWGCKKYPACRGTRRYKAPAGSDPTALDEDAWYRKYRSTGEEFEPPLKETGK